MKSRPKCVTHVPARSVADACDGDLEEMHEKREPLMEAVLDAGIERLLPVMVTVDAAHHPGRLI